MNSIWIKNGSIFYIVVSWLEIREVYLKSFNSVAKLASLTAKHIRGLFQNIRR